MEAEWLSEQLSKVNYYKLWLNKSTAMFLPLPSFTKNSGSGGLSIAQLVLTQYKASLCLYCREMATADQKVKVCLLV